MSTRATIYTVSLSEIWNIDPIEFYQNEVRDDGITERLYDYAMSYNMKDGDFIKIVHSGEEPIYYEMFEGSITFSSYSSDDSHVIQSVISTNRFHPNYWLNVYPKRYGFHIDRDLYQQVLRTFDLYFGSEEYHISDININNEKWMVIIRRDMCTSTEYDDITCCFVPEDILNDIGITHIDKVFMIVSVL